MSEIQKRSIPELSIDTQTLERLLRTVPVGGFISYSALSAAVGRNVQTGARGNLNSARRRLLKAERLLYEPVHNEGLKRLDDRGKVSTGRSHVRRAHNQAKMARAKTTAVDNFDAMPNDLKVEHNIVLAQAGAIKSMTSERSRRQLETSITDTKASLSLRESLQLMKPAI